ncbi:hypothetical protein [Paracoccus chinensis]|uniref:hypothetical protein n=1 Tax=Paracoccus chinensis TaxID=525640 RepID=UPI001113ADA8|nr:hypothetical protein [Paracoccus chinensis]
MSIDTNLDPVAIYAAVLSTALALAQLYRWLTSGPRASVNIINPLEVRRHDRKFIEVVIHNIGTTPIIIREVCVSYSDSRKGRPLKSKTFDSNAGWDPSLRSVPHPTRPNSSWVITNVVAPGHEHHELLHPFSGFDPRSHWLRVSVALRNSNIRFNGYAAPVKRTAA